MLGANGVWELWVSRFLITMMWEILIQKKKTKFNTIATNRFAWNFQMKYPIKIPHMKSLQKTRLIGPNLCFLAIKGLT